MKRIFYIVSYEKRKVGGPSGSSIPGSFIYSAVGEPETDTSAEEMRQEVIRKIETNCGRGYVGVIISMSRLN